jgi:glucose/arabinose dehydrogenase
MTPMKQPRRTLAAIAMAALLAACSAASPTATDGPTTPDPSTEPAPSRPAEPPTPSPQPSAGATERPIADEPPPIALTQVGGGFNAPIGIATAPDGWLLVNEQPGRVMALDVETGEIVVTADLTDRVRSGGEQGLLGLVLHPLWPDEPRAFVHYTDDAGDTVLAELAGSQAAGEAPILDPASERVLLRVDQPYENHNGGQLAFGPDGYLYFGLGDGGAGGDPHGHGQDATTLLGSVLRLDVDGDPYAVPPDNPFGDGADGAPEVFLFGLRNPWRFSFDRATGELWIADVGQNAYEEVNRIDPVADAGANLGWNQMEASHCFLTGCSTDGLVLPVTEYDHGSGCSVTGGHVYRGSAIEGLTGWYVFSDYCSGLIFGVRSDVTELTAPRVLLESTLSVSAFGEDGSGEIYVADLNSGGVFRVDPG